MLLGKVGNKSIAFINHKPFHPGNLLNLERVWLAERKAQENEKEQKEMLERRKYEVQIEELRKALRNKEFQQMEEAKKLSENLSTPSILNSLRTCETEPKKQGLSGPSRTKRRRGESRCINTTKPKIRHNQNETIFKVMSKYKEDVYHHGHSQVWGSYYDKETLAWGYRCCHVLEKNAPCTLSA